MALLRQQPLCWIGDAGLAPAPGLHAPAHALLLAMRVLQHPSLLLFPLPLLYPVFPPPASPFFPRKAPPPPLLHAQQYPPTHRPPDSGVFCHPCRRTITCEPQTCNLRRLRMQQPTAQLLGSPLMCTLNEERSAASKCCVVNKDDFSGHASAALSLGWPRAA